MAIDLVNEMGTRLATLVREGQELIEELAPQDDDDWVDDSEVVVYQKWLASVGNAFLLTGGADSAYVDQFREIVNSQKNPAGLMVYVVRKVFGLLLSALEESTHGTLKMVEAIVAGEGRLEPTHATATILYADIEAFTGIAEALAPGQVVQLLNEYFAAVIEPITRLSGTVNQFQGDALLVTFNVPVADPLHADHAIEAAAAVLRVVTERRFAGIALNVRIGVSTGHVVAGNVGSGERVNYTVHGDAVNVAARLEQLNKQLGSWLLLDEATANRLDQTVTAQFVDELKIRGREANLRVYTVQ